MVQHRALEDEQFIEPIKKIDLCTGAGDVLGDGTTPKVGCSTTPHKSHFSSQFIYRLRSEKQLNRDLEGMT